jgi:hypothetical protein
MPGLAGEATYNEQLESPLEESIVEDDSSDGDFILSPKRRIYDKRTEKQKDILKSPVGDGHRNLTNNRSIPKSINIKGPARNDVILENEEQEEGYTGAIPTLPMEIEETGMVAHMSHVMHGFHEVALEKNNLVFQKSFTDLWCKFDKMDAVCKNNFLRFLVPMIDLPYVDYKVPIVDVDLVTPPMFERLVVGRMLVEFDHTFGDSQPSSDMVTGVFTSVLSMVPSTRAIKIICNTQKSSNTRKDALAEVRSRPLVFIISGYLDLLYPDLFDVTTLGKGFCLAIAGYKIRHVSRLSDNDKDSCIPIQKYLTTKEDRLPPVAVLLVRLLTATRSVFVSEKKQTAFHGYNCETVYAGVKRFFCQR